MAHGEDLAATASATLERSAGRNSYGGSWQEGGARAASPPLQGLAPPAGGAPATRRGRAVGGACACRARVNSAGEDLVVVVVVVVEVVVAATPNYLRLASPDRGKYVTKNI